jgi:superfamily II DNA/RNA helicase
VDLLVATPLRLLALIRAETIDLSKVEIVVLDEADKLFELEGNKKREHQDEVDEDDDDAEENVSSSSFLRQVDEILSKCTCSTLQRGLFRYVSYRIVSSHSFAI